MYSKIMSSVPLGIEGVLVEVETQLQSGLPQHTIVGLPGMVVREAKERVRAALYHAIGTFPMMRITQNMAPSHIKKEGVQLDLAIALGILSAQNKAIYEMLEGVGVIGALTLDGQIKPVLGCYSLLESFRNAGIRKIILPNANVCPSEVFSDLELCGYDSLGTLFEDLEQKKMKPSHRPKLIQDALEQPRLDFKDIRGQSQALRAVEIAIAGAHSLLLVGPPGCGKTMIIERLSSILSPMSLAERIENSKIEGLTNPLADITHTISRPVRKPHHTVSRTALLGGGSRCLPGEISRAHHGILVLDELSEFRTEVLEALREPMSTGEIHLAKHNTALTYPARFQLIATMNPCFCGYNGSKHKACSCSSQQLKKYASKLSGPILDRIDMVVFMDRVEINQMTSIYKSSEAIKERLSKRSTAVERSEAVEASAQKLYESGKLSMRSHGKIMSLAQTIASLEGETVVSTTHFYEAVLYYGTPHRQFLGV